ncbi:glucose-6-phosphate isomerase [Sphaerisporangium rufum]|uniref:glucose-6-phosphate isomerase n=1 Tax=Sphaerisporangium rufum TaxID=1381558 RepID=A0A919V267_9ACTN|nr:glucose-6-phosphate isomerase family protein [Sphaerisporangium rufum]GII81821.1 glucose-6-phosphate isomerase [Sphaerisporangium rufum]
MLQPFTRVLDLGTGDIAPENRLVRRRLSDMRGAYAEDCDGAQVVYEVFNIDVPETNSELQTCTTRLYNGKVGDEYFMTKGHFHEVRDRSEVYLTTSGYGRLVMATEDGRYAIEEMRPGSMNYIPGGWSHRSVNVADEPLVFFAAYIGDSGHDYGSIEERGFPVLVVEGPSGPEVVPNPRYQSS